MWLLNMNNKWHPVRFETYPQNLARRIDELLAVDMFVTTADPVLEPPLVTVNTVLSLLAIDYPAAGEKLACYVSDIGCSPVMFYALQEAVRFARVWVPFCRTYDVAVRAPFRYFSSRPNFGPAENKFLEDWTFMKVLWDNHKSRIGEGFPHLIYISREKSPQHHHHYKAGAMNVLTRVSAIMTNAPIIVNMDCHMIANNPKVALHAMCLLLGFDNEINSGFVQASQRFYDDLKDDPFGIRLEIFFKKLGGGVAGLQGSFYTGTGCFHRRKVIYGMPTSVSTGLWSYKELQEKFGSSKELIESARRLISRNLSIVPLVDISTRIEVAKQVAACNYEIGTYWGQEVGWAYGSMTEDVLTRQRIHVAGWKSTLMDIEPPAFMGFAPTGGPACLTQFKRWAIGFFEIFISQDNPFLATIFKRLQFRQCLAYLVVYMWYVRALFELWYALLGPYCLLTNQSFMAKASDGGFFIPLALFLTYNAYNFVEYMECGLSSRAWWNNHRMQRIISPSSWLLAFLTVLLKTLGLFETVFEVTRKDKSTLNGNATDHDDMDDLGRFTFDVSPVSIPVTALAILNIIAIMVGSWRVVHGTAGGVPGGHPGLGEFMACGWVVLCLLPFVRGLVIIKGNYGIPWSVKLKASLLVAMFLQFCKTN